MTLEAKILIVTDIVGVIGGIYILLLEYRFLPKKLDIPGYIPSKLMKIIGFVILISCLKGLFKYLL
jgi:hypothetical protein